VRVACAQYAIRDGDPDANLESALRFIRRAASEDADLVVLPELANSGGGFRSREHALKLAEPLPDGPTVQSWKEAATEHGGHIVGGILEREGDRLYNSAVVIGADYFGRYRKTHLWDSEKLLYEPGRELPVFDTPLGKIGVLICYDAWFPEAARALAMKGAEILCIPSNAPDDWVPEKQRQGGLTMLDVHTIAHANANRVFTAATNRVGDGYLGRSIIVDTTGGILAFGGATKEDLISAEVGIERSSQEKQLTDCSHAFRDRNFGAYESHLPEPARAVDNNHIKFCSAEEETPY